jgi:activator of 2-hydroxyglutaryl-CoA dehydratase
MVKSFGVEQDVVFVGGVANNIGVRKCLEDFLKIKFPPLSQNPQIVGALGAALIAEDFLEGKKEL